MRRLLTGVLLILMVLSLASCGHAKPIRGEIVAMVVVPPYTSTIFIPVCVSYGKYGCQVTTIIPVPIHHGTDYRVNVKVCDVKGCKGHWRSVKAEYYGQVHIGDIYAEKGA